MTAASPRIGASRSTLSTPFCTVITRVSGPTSGRGCSPARSVSHSLTAKSTRSTGPIPAGSSVTLTSFEMQVAERALDLEAVAADGVAMRAAREERDLVTGRRQPRAEITADGARRHDRDPHVVPPQDKVSSDFETSAADPIHRLVIPGRGLQPASPESITTAGGYGFRARAQERAPRNDSN